MVFGKVIRGYDDVVKRVAQVPVDEKDRPLSPILLSNCGELELRKPPAPAPVQAPQAAEQEGGVSERRRTRRSRSVSSSPEREQRSRKKSKHKKKSNDVVVDEPANREPVEETEEEYDARLEREENERFEEERRKELARIKEKYEKEIQSKNGVRFKGQLCPCVHRVHFN